MNRVRFSIYRKTDQHALRRLYTNRALMPCVPGTSMPGTVTRAPLSAQPNSTSANDAGTCTIYVPPRRTPLPDIMYRLRACTRRTHSTVRPAVRCARGARRSVPVRMTGTGDTVFSGGFFMQDDCQRNGKDCGFLCDFLKKT